MIYKLEKIIDCTCLLFIVSESDEEKIDVYRCKVWYDHDQAYAWFRAELNVQADVNERRNFYLLIQSKMLWNISTLGSVSTHEKTIIMSTCF